MEPVGIQVRALKQQHWFCGIPESHSNSCRSKKLFSVPLKIPFFSGKQYLLPAILKMKFLVRVASKETMFLLRKTGSGEIAFNVMQVLEGACSIML
jgi:hypothetical protein